ncbi:MAG: DUF5103 domain-containing protein [Bacteroidota bacterium]
MITSFLVSVTPLIAQPEIQHMTEVKDSIYDQSIGTVKVFRTGWELSHPIISFNSEESLNVIFDDFTEQMRYFEYTLVHCNADWSVSDLYYNEYMEGFEYNSIYDSQYSTNTFFDYTHYSFHIPNEDVAITKPGNYVLLVRIQGTEDVVFTRRFLVVDQRANLEATVIRPRNPLYSETHQQVEVIVNAGGLNINNPREDVWLNIYQNNRWDVALTDVKPDFTDENRLTFSNDISLVMPGGEEFHNFDMKSFKYQSADVAAIEYKNPYYHIYLKPDEVDRFKPYFYKEDLNGNYLVKNDEGSESSIDADYMYVHFFVPMEEPLFETNVFVNGRFNSWARNENNQMQYDATNKAYYLRLLLKQGFYDYNFVMNDARTGEDVSIKYTSNHFETENDYLIVVYYHDFSLRIDLPVGFKRVNSAKD